MNFPQFGVARGSGAPRLCIPGALVLSCMVLLGVAPSARAKTINQVPFVSGQWSVPKVTRSYTTHSDSIGRNLFYRLAGAGSFLYEDNRGELNVLVFCDPGWNRVLFAVEGEVIKSLGTYGSGQDQFVVPGNLDVAPIGNVFIADTGNNRVVGYSFSGRKFDIQGAMTQDDKLVYQFTIQGADNFAQPIQVCWEDGGTPAVSTDDYIWALDRWRGKIAGYHVNYDGTHYVASPYINLDLRSCGLCRLPADPRALTKGRAYQSADESGSYCTNDLYVYDAANDQFLIYTIQRDPGFISAAMQPLMVSIRTVPNPIPSARYNFLSADAWGNICAIDDVGSRVCKFDSNLTPLDTYGQAGSGPLGSEDMLDPVALSFQKIKHPGSGNQFTNRCMLIERWSDQTGIQNVMMGITARDLLSQARTGSDSVDVSYFTTDHARTTVEILNSSGAVIRTLLGGALQVPGLHTMTWEGKNDAGARVTRCTTYSARVRAISLYASPETSTVRTEFYYKPRLVSTLQVSVNVPGTRLSVDGRDSVLAGNTYALACSVCTAHTIGPPPAQMINGTRYCFDSWTRGGNRLYTVNVMWDSTLALRLTTGSPPDTFPDMVTLPVELYECNSPYVFLRDASTSAFGLTLFPNTALRFKVLANNQVPPRFQIRGPFTATGVTFQTTDSISNTNPGKWSGLLVDSVTTVALKNCNMTNASVGISTSGLRKLRTLTVDSCYFQFNSKDIQAKFLPTTGTVLRLSGNRFLDSSPIDIWGSAGGAEPTVGCTISSNTFGGLPVSAMVALTGGMQGQINSNWFRGGERNTTTLYLAPYYGSSGPYPDVSLRDNKFNFNSTSTRCAVSAPVAPPGSSIYAYYNDWGLYDATSIGEIIYDHTDDALRATVWYEPFTVPSGGGGGGGGCPFVLTPTDTGFVTENSILGASELDPSHVRFVDDAYPLSNAIKMPNGHVRIRVAEPESETDVLDYLGLSAQVPEQSDDLGSSPDGRAFAYHIIQRELTTVRWNGRSEPFISPIAPGTAYRGEAGDSLELQVDATSPVQGTPPTGRRGIGISLIPKPIQLPRPAGSPVGITLRVSPDASGGRWLTVGALVPREHWSTAIIPSDLFADQEIRRLRLIWHSTHTLGWVGLVDTRSLPDLATLPLTGARNSSGVEVAGELRAKDGKSITLRSGDFVDLDFDASSVDAPGARFILLARGRYWPATASPSSGVPTAYGISQNRPNPFNPETAIDLSLPQRSHVSLRVFDVSGKLVRKLVDAPLPAGFHVIRRDDLDERGKDLASGVYFYDLRAERFSALKRMVILR